MDLRRNVYRGRVVSVGFALHRPGIASCAVGRELRHAVFDIVAGEALLYARGHAPVDDGDYARAFEVDNSQFTTLPNEWPMRRVSCHLANTAPHATAVEMGSGERGSKEGHWVFRRTLQHLNRLSRQ